MDTTVKLQTEQQAVLDRVESILKELTPQDLIVVERFIRFVREQAERGGPIRVSVPEPSSRPPYKYPTVALPVASLKAWSSLLPEGYEGDALADSEALSDDA